MENADTGKMQLPSKSFERILKENFLEIFP
jgi:hypothetical protein